MYKLPKLLILCYILFSAFTVNAQQFDAQKFEKKLNRFQYDFFKDFSENSYRSDNISDSKIAQFLQTNADEIAEYRNYLVERYQVMQQDTTGYVIDDSTELSIYNLSKKNLAESFENSQSKNSVVENLYKLMVINPVNVFYGISQGDCIQYLRRQEITVSEIGMVFSIARPIVNIFSKDAKNITICIDYYSNKYFVDFDLAENNFSNLKSYKRKN